MTASDPHYDVNGNMDCRGWNIPAQTCTPTATADAIQWTSFNLPKRLERLSAYSTLDYGPDRQVIRQVKSSPTDLRIINTVGPHFEYEVAGSTVRWRNTVYVDGQAVYLQVDEELPGQHGGSTINYYSYYVHHDHQGSWDHLTSAWGSGGPIPYSFDAFGKRREADWTADVDNSQLYITDHMSRRGYTGHEHLDHVGMIHMNGRVQDPVLGRMISRDPMLGDIANPETLNRYAYAENNPATLTDPTGFYSCYNDPTCTVYEEGYWTYGELINHDTGRRVQADPFWTPPGQIRFEDGSNGPLGIDSVGGAASGIAATVAYEATVNGAARSQYQGETSTLDSQDKLGREAAKDRARGRMTQNGRAILDSVAPRRTARPQSVDGANRTNANFNRAGKALRVSGRASTVTAVVFGAYRVNVASDRGRASFQLATGTVGALAIGTLGGIAGTAVVPGPGTALGILGGSAAGGVAGEYFGGQVYDYFSAP